MELNFLRRAKVIVDGKEFDSNNYEFIFNVDRRFSNNGNEAEVNFFFISDSTKNLFKLKSKIEILAGYDKGSVGLIFSGEIDETTFNDKDGIDILCTEGNKEWTNEVVNKSFKSGDKGISLLEIVKNIASNSSIKHYYIQADDYTYKRGLNCQGTLRSELSKLAEVVGAITYIKKNKIYFVRKDYNNLETEISSATGLMEIKNKDDNDYILTMLLNHRIEEDSKLHVKGSNIEFKARVLNVSHKYDKNRFQTVIECTKEVMS